MSKEQPLPLAYYGNPILRKKGEPITEINDELKKFVARMFVTLKENNGIGLAAPQVHLSKLLFITYVPTQDKDGEWKDGTLRVFINPTILSVGEEETDREEGCLSIPGVYGSVTRPLTVRVKATNLEGEEFEDSFSGLEARCILHENDHINGTLFVDRIRGKERRHLEPKLKACKKKYKHLE